MRLIDADALKEELLKEEYVCWADDCAVTHETIKSVIDNAPTVEHSLLPLASDLDSAYMRGYEVGKAEGIMKASTRPQGEWEDYSADFYKCPECGYLLDKLCPQCYNKVILPKGSAK